MHCFFHPQTPSVSWVAHLYEPHLEKHHAGVDFFPRFNGLNAHFSGSGLHATAVHPGLISTNLGRHVDMSKLEKLIEPMKPYMKSIPQGAATTVWAATAKQWEGTGMDTMLRHIVCALLGICSDLVVRALLGHHSLCSAMIGSALNMG